MRAANILTLSRVLLAPVVAYFILTDARYFAAALYAIAAYITVVGGVYTTVDYIVYSIKQKTL